MVLEITISPFPIASVVFSAKITSNTNTARVAPTGSMTIPSHCNTEEQGSFKFNLT